MRSTVLLAPNNLCQAGSIMRMVSISSFLAVVSMDTKKGQTLDPSCKAMSMFQCWLC